MKKHLCILTVLLFAVLMAGSSSAVCVTDGLCDGVCPADCTSADDPDCSPNGCCGDGLVQQPNIQSTNEECDDGIVLIPITTCEDLQGIGGTTELLGGNYILTKNIDCIGFDADADGKGFKPIGTSADKFEGILDGRGYEIINLTINRPGEWYIGLFGVIGSAGEIRNLGLIDAIVTTDGSFVGILAGESKGTIENVYSTGSVEGWHEIGSLIGYNSGLIRHSYSSASATGEGDVGGLAGINGGTIEDCYSTGDVHSEDPSCPPPSCGSVSTGGLVGYNAGPIIRSYSSSQVSGDRQVGGIAGVNHGSIESSYSTGAVDGFKRTGGLVGDNDGTIDNSYSLSTVNGVEDIGGLVGIHSFFLATITNSFSAGQVVGTINVGGLVGSTDLAATCADSFWDMDIGYPTSNCGVGETGKSTTEMEDILTFNSFWDFGTVWTIAGSYPYFQFQDNFQSFCGNNLCEAGETPSNCPGDCGAGPISTCQGSCLTECVCPVNIIFNKCYDTGRSDHADSIKQTSDGGYIMAGSTSAGSNTNIWLVKIDAIGNEEWNKTFGTGGDIADDVTQTSDGGYILFGATWSLGPKNALMIKTDASGNEEWSKIFEGETTTDARAGIQTSDGGYAFVGAFTSADGTIVDAWLVKTDASGNEEWRETFDGPIAGVATSVVQTSDGGYAIGAYTNSPFNNAWLIKTDASGTKQWNKVFGGAQGDKANSIKQTSDGGYILAGYTFSFALNGGFDVWLIKTDASGTEDWSKTFGGGLNLRDSAKSVIQTSDGGYAIGGYTESLGSGGHLDALIIKTDSDGVEEWNRTFGGTGLDRALEIVQTGDGGYAVGGYTYSYGDPEFLDFWLIKTDSLGNTGVSSGVCNVCSPQTCASLGYECGSWFDGCLGMTPDCGSCTAPEVCVSGFCETITVSGPAEFQIVSFNLVNDSGELVSLISVEEGGSVPVSAVVTIRNIGADPGDVVVEIVVKDIKGNPMLVVPVTDSSLDLSGGNSVEHIFVINVPADFDSSREPDVYTFYANVGDGSPPLNDQKLKTLTLAITKPAPVPELDFVFIPLLALSVLTVLFFADKKYSSKL